MSVPVVSPPIAMSSSAPPRLVRPPAAMLALLVAALFLPVAGSANFFAWTANTGMDLLFRLRGPLPADGRIVIVGVDETSLDRYGRWPFPRRLHAELLDRLQGARAVGLDFIFAEAGPDDDALSSAMARSREAGTPVILAVAPGGADAPDQMLRPHPGITGYAGVGHIESMISGDGIVRRVAPRGAEGVPALALALARAAGQNVDEGDGAGGAARVINFAGPEASFLTLSYRDVLAGRYPAAAFKDRFVLVGAQARGLGDAYITAFTRAAPTPGVEIQANILSNLLNRAFLRPLPWLSWGLMVLFACLPLALWPRLGPRSNLAFNLGLAALTLAAAWLLFQRCLFFDFLLPLGFLLGAYLLYLLLELFQTATRILQQARVLDRQLDERLRVAPLLPLLAPAAAGGRAGAATPPAASGPGGLRGHLARLKDVASALSMQHHFLNTLLRDEMPPLILWESASGRTIFANEPFRVLWRTCADEVEATGDHPLPRLTGFLARMAELTGREGDRLLRFDGSDGETTRFDLRLRLSGRLRDLRGSLRELHFPDSGKRATLALFSDITEVRELERVKDEVVAIVSHELKQPLTVILGYGQMLAENLEGPELRYAENICRQSERLNRMIRDFLDIARLESGRRRPQPRVFHLDRLLDEVLEGIRPTAAKKGIELRRIAPETVPPCLGDEDLLAHALLNLLDNAVKFSPEGTTVDLRLAEEPDRFVLRVADEGPGIPPEERERIFEKFRRGSRTEKDEGFGLGLHLAQRIVEAHGGTIAALDVPRGATFEIVLPRAGEVEG